MQVCGLLDEHTYGGLVLGLVRLQNLHIMFAILIRKCGMQPQEGEGRYEDSAERRSAQLHWRCFG